MSFKKFNSEDVFFATIKAKPKFEFKIFNGKTYLNNSDGYTYLNNLLITPPVEGCDIRLDFSCADNSQYLVVI